MARTILYLDPWSGMSGDMILGCAVGQPIGAAPPGERVAEAPWLVSACRGVSVEVEPRHGMGRCLHAGQGARGRAPLRCAILPRWRRIIARPRCRQRCRRGRSAAVRRLAEIEAAVHGCAPDQIHFHEVGAVDTLVDVVGTFVADRSAGDRTGARGHYSGGRRHGRDSARAHGGARAGDGALAGGLSRSWAVPRCAS